jgi:hypothetical protein
MHACFCDTFWSSLISVGCTATKRRLASIRNPNTVPQQFQRAMTHRNCCAVILAPIPRTVVHCTGKRVHFACRSRIAQTDSFGCHRSSGTPTGHSFVVPELRQFPVSTSELADDSPDRYDIPVATSPISVPAFRTSTHDTPRDFMKACV